MPPGGREEYRRRAEEPDTEIEEQRAGRTLVMAPQGRLDARSAQDFGEQLLGRIDGGEASIVLDLSRIDFLGSAGLRVVLSAAKRLRDVDGQFAVCGLREHVRELFRVGGFDAIIDIHSDRPTALAKLK